MSDSSASHSDFVEACNKFVVWNLPASLQYAQIPISGFSQQDSTNPLFRSTNKCFVHQTLSVLFGVKNIVTAQNGANALNGCTLRRHDDSRRHKSVAVVTSAVPRAITTIRRSCYRTFSQNCRPPRYVIRISSISAFVGDNSGKREV